MNRIKSNCQNSNRLTARRRTLLASVGGIGAVVLLPGPSGRYWPPASGAVPASAAEIEMQRPIGFADIVAKVKPAVISVRVKVSSSAEPAVLQDNREDGEQQIPLQPDSPLDRFFQPFGDRRDQQFGPRAPQRRDTITGEGSGFFITAAGYDGILRVGLNYQFGDFRYWHEANFTPRSMDVRFEG